MDTAVLAHVQNLLKERKHHAADVFDIDGTVFRGRLLFNLIYAIAEEIPACRRHHDYLKSVMQLWICGAISTAHLNNTPIDLAEKGFFVGLERSHVEDIARRTAHQLKGAIFQFPVRLIEMLRARPIEERKLLIAITGAPTEIVTAFCEGLDFDVIISTVYYTDDQGRYTRKKDLSAAFEKGAIMDQLKAECGIGWEDALGVGDTSADIPILERVGFPLAINPDLKLQKYMRERNRHVAFISDSEKKGIQIFKYDDDKRLREVVQLTEILPADIAQSFPSLEELVR